MGIADLNAALLDRAKAGEITSNRTRDRVSVMSPVLRRRNAPTEKLCRRYCRERVSFTVLGVRIGIRANLPDLLDPLMSRVPVRCTPISSYEVDRLYSVIGAADAGLMEPGHRFHFLFANTRQLARAASREELCEAFEADLGCYVGQTVCSWLFVHAGVVGWKSRAIVIPGRSYSGKTTLVQALLKEGATYYSDEFAVFDQGGRVYPYPRHLAVRTGSVAKRIAAAQLGAQTGSGPLPMGLVILTRYKPRSHWRPRVLSPGRGMLGLLQNSLSARRHPELAFQALGRAVNGAQVLSGARGEAKETARRIIQHLEVDCVACSSNWRSR